MISTLAAILGLFFVLWMVSLVMRDASIVDSAWGIAFLVIASASSAATEGAEPRVRLVLVLTAAWGLRLSFHILTRNLGAGEDYRYREMRRSWGTRFPVMSLFTVFGLQAVIAWIVSLPIQFAIAAASPADLTWIDAVGVLVWTFGFLFEAVADFQLLRFKSDRRNAGRVMNRGLWRYSRHPNYFGDAVVWWGFFLFAAATGAWWTAVGPALMTFLLLRVSGVTLLEKRLHKTKPAYETYAARTNAFLPWKPRSN